MSLLSAIFYLIGGVTVAATALAVTRREPVHAVVYLIVSFFGTAMLFFLLGAPLLAALEVILYAGAIMVLFLFILMTVRREAEDDPADLSFGHWVFPGAMVMILLTAGGALVFADSATTHSLKLAMASPAAFGVFLFREYWFPVEVVSFLLFVGLVGAWYLGKQEDGKEGS